MDEPTPTPSQLQPPRKPAMDDATDKSRQKSCHACVRSKRRCDKRTPRCTRCAEKGFSCLYVNLPLAGAAARQRMAMAMATTTAGQPQRSAVTLSPGLGGSPAEMDLEALGLLPDPDFELDPGPGCTPGPQSSSDAALDDAAMLSDVDLGFDMPTFDFNNLMNYMTVDQQGGKMQLWHNQEPPKTTTPRIATPPPLDRNPHFSIEERRAMTEGCENFTPWNIHEPGSRIGFVVASFKEFPILLARERETPFLHRHLYRNNTPRAMLTAYSAATAYANRTDANRAWAFRVLCEAADELLGMPGRSQGQALAQALDMQVGPAAGAWTPYEKLARTQALLVYQLIRVFDGDIALAAQAERDMGTLEAWIAELEEYRDNLAELWLLEESTLRERPPRSWERWIFAECVRRTIMLGYSFIAMVGMLKASGTATTPDPGRFAAIHRWTASRHLWEAESPVAFMAAWRDKRQWLVQNFFVQELPRTMKATDMDKMARMILTAFMGTDEMEQWVSGGGTLQGTVGCSI